MWNYARWGVLALAVTITLGVASGGSAANQFSISEGNIRVVWDELTLNGPTQIICEVTLSGSIHATSIQKEVQLLGHITAAASDLPACTGGGAGEPDANSLPWHIRYLGWEGTLPNIEELYLSLDGVSFDLLELPFGITCEYEGNLLAIALLSGSGTVLLAEEVADLRRTGGSFLCSSELTAEGAAPVRTPDDEPVIVSLI